MENKTLIQAFGTGAATALGSYIVPKACDAVIPALQGNQLAEHPVETAVTAALAGIIGFALGYAARGESHRMSRSERRCLERQERELKTEEFENAKRSFYELDPDLKALLLASLVKGGAYCNGSDWRFSRLPDEPFITQFVMTRYIDDDVAKITALPLLQDFSEQVPDAFEGVESTLEKHARDRDSSAVVHFNASSVPNWWWYR